MNFVFFGGFLFLVCEYLTVFGFLFFALPVASFMIIKLWSAARASKSQRKTEWFVPNDLESESARFHYGMGHQSVEFARQARRGRR